MRERRDRTRVYAPNSGVDVYIYDGNNRPKLSPDVEQYLRPRSSFLSILIGLVVICSIGCMILFAAPLLFAGVGRDGAGIGQNIGTQNCGGMFNNCNNVVVNPNANTDASQSTVNNTLNCPDGAIQVGQFCQQGNTVVQPDQKYTGQMVPTMDPNLYKQYLPTSGGGLGAWIIVAVVGAIVLSAVIIGSAKRKRG